MTCLRTSSPKDDRSTQARVRSGRGGRYENFTQRPLSDYILKRNDYRALWCSWSRAKQCFFFKPQDENSREIKSGSSIKGCHPIEFSQRPQLHGERKKRQKAFSTKEGEACVPHFDATTIDRAWKMYHERAQGKERRECPVFFHSTGRISHLSLGRRFNLEYRFSILPSLPPTVSVRNLLH